MDKPVDFDDYISQFPKDIQKRLQAIRETIGQAAPEAEEVISYSMPLYKFKGRLIYFAAHTNHIGLYPMGSSIEAFAEELESYKTSKGTVQLQNDEPLPLELISRIVKFRVIENLKKRGEINCNKIEKNTSLREASISAEGILGKQSRSSSR